MNAKYARKIHPTWDLGSARRMARSRFRIARSFGESLEEEDLGDWGNARWEVGGGETSCGGGGPKGLSHSATSSGCCVCMCTATPLAIRALVQKLTVEAESIKSVGNGFSKTIFWALAGSSTSDCNVLGGTCFLYIQLFQTVRIPCFQQLMHQLIWRTTHIPLTWWTMPSQLTLEPTHTIH